MAVPARGADAAFLSSGTWSLLGVENPEPITTPESRASNFTNEGGYPRPLAERHRAPRGLSRRGRRIIGEYSQNAETAWRSPCVWTGHTPEFRRARSRKLTT